MAIKLKRVEKNFGSYKVVCFYLDCTKQLQELFGNSVKEAFLEITESPLSQENETKKVAKDMAEKVLDKFNKNKNLAIDGSYLLITFTNGKKICTWNSEWGSIRPWDGEFK